MIIKTQDRFSSALLHTITMLSACLQHHVYPRLSPCSLHLLAILSQWSPSSRHLLFFTHGNPMVWLVFLLPGTRYGRSTGIPCFFLFSSVFFGFLPVFPTFCLQSRCGGGETSTAVCIRFRLAGIHWRQIWRSEGEAPKCIFNNYGKSPCY